MLVFIKLTCNLYNWICFGQLSFQPLTVCSKVACVCRHYQASFHQAMVEVCLFVCLFLYETARGLVVGRPGFNFLVESDQKTF